MLIDEVKQALRVASCDYYDEIKVLILAGFHDLGIVDIKPEMLDTTQLEFDPLITRAVVTYCKMNFGYLSNDQYQKFKASYDEQKAQLLMSSKYTDWGGSNA